MHSIYLKTLPLVLISGAACFSQAAAVEGSLGQDVPQQVNGSQDTKRDTYQLDKVGVTAKRLTEKPESPYSVTESSQLQTEVITREEIEAIHPQTVWEILEQVPGIEVTYQGRQHLEFSNVRGTGSFGIILDGVYITQVDRVIASLPVDTIESVTVVRDATALTLGPLTNFGSTTGASNQGFILIKTKRASKLEGGFVGSAGTFDAQKYGLSLGSKSGNFDYRVAGTYDYCDGKPGWNMQTRNTSILFRGGYTGSSFDADLLYFKGHGKRNMEWGQILIPTGNDWSKVGTLSASAFNLYRLDPEMVALNLTKRWTPSQATTFNFAYNGIGIVVDTSATSHATPQNTYGTTFSLRHVITSQFNIFKVGVQHLTYLSPLAQAGGSPPHDDEAMNSLFLQDEYKLLGGRLTLDGGLRADRKTYNNGYLKGTGSAVDAKVAPAYSFGASYKPCTVITLTGRFAYTENSKGSYQVSPTGAALPSEKRKKYEVGLLANLHSAFNPSVTAYYYDTKDQAVGTTALDPNSTSTTKVASYIDPATGEEVDFVTTASVVTHGLESSVSGQIVRPLNYRLSWSYVTTDNATTNASMSRHLASGSLRYKQGGFGANVSAHYAGPKNRSSSPLGVFYYELGDYTRVDANVDYGFKAYGRDAKVTLYGRNFGDTQYATRYVTGAYRDPGFTYGVQFACSLF